MSLHYPQGYRYRSASRTGGGIGIGGEQGSDSDVAELSDLEDDEDEDEAREFAERRVVVEEEDEDDEDGENDEDDDNDDDDDDDEDDEDEEEEEGEGLPYPGFVPIALRYLDQTTRPRNWCLALITNPYPFDIFRLDTIDVFIGFHPLHARFCIHTHTHIYCVSINT